MTIGGVKVLLVEDDLDIRELLAAVLTSHGADVIARARGEEALEVLSVWRPDVALLDLQLPGMDGFATLRAIRGLQGYAEIPAVALTALSEREARARMSESGFSALVLKPAPLAEIVAAIMAVAGRRA